MGTHHTHTFGNSTSVKERFGSENSAIRAEKLEDVVCVNETATNPLFLQVHELTPGLAVAVPAEGSVPKFAFPVFAGIGGALGRSIDMAGVYCCWSTTQDTKTIVLANSGPIQIIVKA